MQNGKNKLKCSIIGMGKQAIKGILGSDKCKLIAICDTNLAISKEWSNKLKVAGYSSTEELIENEEMDFVILTLPHNAYRNIMEYISKKHIHILKEKPFARNLKEAVYFEELGKKFQIQIMTALQRRFDPIFASFSGFVSQIGKPFFIKLKYTFFLNDWRRAGEHLEQSLEEERYWIWDTIYRFTDLVFWSSRPSSCRIFCFCETGL